MGIKPDESVFQPGDYGSYRQTQRLDNYKKYIEKLLVEKKAYFCFCSPEKLAQEKEQFIKENKRSNYQYSRKCLNLNDKEVQTFIRQQIPYVIRLKIPQERNYLFHDLVRGEVKFAGKDIEDFVLFRQNGIPNYNFACVIDDYLMKISHVLRGEEHLSNTGKQLVLYEEFGLSEAIKEFNLEGLNAMEIIDGQDGNMYLYVGEKNANSGREIKIGIAKGEFETKNAPIKGSERSQLEVYWYLFLETGQPLTPTEKENYYRTLVETTFQEQ
ncbi:10309_t:CDS:2 [Funneliformis geosporum]|uniref:10309_t:CDS:1 n=1 Tax=Funneliformis geosporum TaxID=1117311 RepID=A0A9W4WVX4_9GLOM|nr:10309_t:CDS:2 [Funneliformis geosporum]